MGHTFRTKKGLDIPLKGMANKDIQKTELTKFYAVKPPDFFHFIPKIVAKPGTKIKAGDVLFYNKFLPEITVTSPVSGKVDEVLRGEKRKILEEKLFAKMSKKKQNSKEFYLPLKVNDILQTHKPVPLNPEVDREVDNILKMAAKSYGIEE